MTLASIDYNRVCFGHSRAVSAHFIFYHYMRKIEWSLQRVSAQSERSLWYMVKNSIRIQLGVLDILVYIFIFLVTFRLIRYVKL